jgi:predicted AlkP superfamily phosphohydrolase/phosphomutase
MVGKRSAVLLIMILAAGSLPAGCGRNGHGRASAPQPSRLLVIGIDSADWRLLEPMIAEGRLPRLAAFRAQAASGRMQSFSPLAKSPLLWASICTGVEPAVHGVSNFVEGYDQDPVTGSAWYAPAIWDMLGATGRTTAVSGMWTTYPARPIDGVMVSDYLSYGKERIKPLEGLVYPASLTERVVACRVDPRSLQASDLARFLPPGADVATIESAYPQEMRWLREIWASDLGYLNVARLLKDVQDFDLFLFYLRGPDMMSHHFFRYLVSDSTSQGIDPAKLVAFGDMVRRYYHWVDEAVGEVLSWFPADRQTVIVSDHGFLGPRPDGGRGIAEHSEWGIFLVRSPLYEPGSRFGHLKLLDICPTMLALLGLPPAADMPGAVLAENLTVAGRPRVERIEKNRVPSYLALRPAEGPAVERDTAVDEEIRRQLRSLGYVK